MIKNTADFIPPSTRLKRTDFIHPSTLTERLWLRHDQSAATTKGGHISIYGEAADKLEKFYALYMSSGCQCIVGEDVVCTACKMGVILKK